MDIKRRLTRERIRALVGVDANRLDVGVISRRSDLSCGCCWVNEVSMVWVVSDRNGKDLHAE